MSLKPWYKVVTPREDLREGRPLDASEFAVHLDHVRDGRAPEVYQNPVRFFEHTYLTKSLRELAAQTVRRLNGLQVETSAVFNLATQFGGGKTHALTLLYHLAGAGEAGKRWRNVDEILLTGKVTELPRSARAVFVGTEFDSISGRGGEDGSPKRYTPWGEIAFQLGEASEPGGGAAAFEVVRQHDEQRTAPAGDVLEALIPKDRPTLILLDELMNYVNRSRKSGMAGQFYSFLQNLSEVARSRDKIVVAVSIPASELEMTPEDQSDFERFKKLLDRLGKAIVMSAEGEASEIIRRRLFDWGGHPGDATATLNEYEEWFLANKELLPNWFPVEHAREALKSTYPFHPTVLSVFERKWQALPRFQQTRGILRLLALWVSNAYQAGYKGSHRDPLITLGTAPLEDPTFRSALFEQLGESKLEGAVTTDIAGKEHAHAVRLDAESVDEVKKARLHRKIATVIFFESNGGQQKAEATQPEIRLGVAEPAIEIGHVEQCLEALVTTCYYLSSEKNRYRFSFKPNLNKILADRRATVSGKEIDERIRAEVQKAFPAGAGAERVFYPGKSGDIPDRPVLALVVMKPEDSLSDPATRKRIAELIQGSGASARTFKSALIFSVADDAGTLQEEARKLLAWQDIENDADALKLDEGQERQLIEMRKRAERDLRDAIWRTYRTVILLADGGALAEISLGLLHSSSTAGGGMVEVILSRLRQDEVVAEGVSPQFLTRNWPPALEEWSTRGVRDAFFASPKFPRLMKPEAVRDTISRGLDGGHFAYVGKGPDGTYQPFVYKKSLPAAEVEISDDVYLISKQRAEEYLPKPTCPSCGAAQPAWSPEGRLCSTCGHGAKKAACPKCGMGEPKWEKSAGVCQNCGYGKVEPVSPPPPPSAEGYERLRWSGEVPAQKWMNFYTKVLAPFATGGGLRLIVSLDAAPPGGVSTARAQEARAAIQELGFDGGSFEAVTKKKGE